LRWCSVILGSTCLWQLPIVREVGYISHMFRYQYVRGAGVLQYESTSGHRRAFW
jgi:hypothetical protein